MKDRWKKAASSSSVIAAHHHNHYIGHVHGTDFHYFASAARCLFRHILDSIKIRILRVKAAVQHAFVFIFFRVFSSLCWVTLEQFPCHALERYHFCCCWYFSIFSAHRWWIIFFSLRCVRCDLYSTMEKDAFFYGYENHARDMPRMVLLLIIMLFLATQPLFISSLLHSFFSPPLSIFRIRCITSSLKAF